MKLASEPNTPSARRQTRLRWTQRLLFITGILLLGYVGFTLLEARLYQASAKRSLENQIRLQNDQVQKEQVEKEQGENHTKPVTSRAVTKTGDVLGRMDIPRLGMSVAVLQGTSSRVLRLGIGHIAGTPLPGEDGNIGIAGHRDTFFRGLKDIRKNDEIQIQTARGLSRYEVDWAKVVANDDQGVLAPSTNSALTLVTCYPFYFVGPAPKRFVVRAHKY